MPIYPSSEQIERLLAGPSDTPVVMVNVLRFKSDADAPDQGMTGQQAYERYAEGMREVVPAYGGRFVWFGRVDSIVIGDAGERFDAVALVEYPSRQRFVEMTQDPRVQELGEHRAAGLESQWLIATTAGVVPGGRS